MKPKYLDIQETETVEYADCTSAEGYPPNKVACWPWVATRNAWGWDPGVWAVMWLSTLHFGPYWARQAVGEAQSDQSAGQVSPLLDLYKNQNDDDGCWVNHAEDS